MIYRVLGQIRTIDLWFVVQRHLLALIGAMVVVGLVTYLSLSMIKAQYTSKAVVLLQSNTGRAEVIDPTRMQHLKDLLYSRHFLKSVAEKLKISRHPYFVNLNSEQKKETILETLSKSTNLMHVPGTNILNIETTSGNAKLSADIVNGLATQFVKSINLYALKSSIVPLKDDVSGSFTNITPYIVNLAVPAEFASYPKKGPWALFLMSLTGVFYVLVLLVREFLFLYKIEKEKQLDEHHHILDRQQGLKQDVEHKSGGKLFRFSHVGAIEKGVHPWQPEEKIEDVMKQLAKLRTSVEPFKIIVSGENEDVKIADEALEIARIFATLQVPTLLVDIGEQKGGISERLHFTEDNGFSNLLEDSQILSGVVKSDPETSLQVVPSGFSKKVDLYHYDPNNIQKIFNAWSSVYEVVIVCCSYDVTLDLHQILDNYFDVGIFIQKDTIVANEVISKHFISNVDEFEVIFYRQSVEISDNHEVEEMLSEAS